MASAGISQIFSARYTCTGRLLKSGKGSCCVWTAELGAAESVRDALPSRRVPAQEPSLPALCAVVAQRTLDLLDVRGAEAAAVLVDGVAPERRAGDDREPR